MPTGSALQTASKTGCGFCSKDHPTWKCWGVLKLSIPDREQRIKQAGLCYICLRGDHFADKCVLKCYKCHGKHNAMCCVNSVSDDKSFGNKGL